MGSDVPALQINPKNIELEITESMLMKDLESRALILEKFNELGVIIAIDDFGTGYSCLNYLKKLPIKILKIDKSFVSDIPDDPNDVEIVSAIITMAHKLGLKVVAEGAETKSQIDTLRKLECDYIQGYFFGMPSPCQSIQESIVKQEMNYQYIAV